MVKNHTTLWSPRIGTVLLLFLAVEFLPPSTCNGLNVTTRMRAPILISSLFMMHQLEVSWTIILLSLHARYCNHIYMQSMGKVITPAFVYYMWPVGKTHHNEAIFFWVCHVRWKYNHSFSFKMVPKPRPEMYELTLDHNLIKSVLIILVVCFYKTYQ